MSHIRRWDKFYCIFLCLSKNNSRFYDGFCFEQKIKSRLNNTTISLTPAFKKEQKFCGCFLLLFHSWSISQHKIYLQWSGWSSRVTLASLLPGQNYTERTVPISHACLVLPKLSLTGGQEVQVEMELLIGNVFCNFSHVLHWFQGILPNFYHTFITSFVVGCHCS